MYSANVERRDGLSPDISRPRRDGFCPGGSATGCAYPPEPPVLAVNLITDLWAVHLRSIAGMNRDTDACPRRTLDAQISSERMNGDRAGKGDDRRWRLRQRDLHDLDSTQHDREE